MRFCHASISFRHVFKLAQRALPLSITIVVVVAVEATGVVGVVHDVVATALVVTYILIFIFFTVIGVLSYAYDYLFTVAFYTSYHEYASHA